MRLVPSVVRRCALYGVCAGLVVLIPGCKDEAPPTVATGSGIFADGCPVAGQATARVITAPDAFVEGPDAVGGPQDYLLMNENAAFVVSAPDSGTTYYHYGGILVDAMTVEGCAQRTQDKLEEMGLVIGRLDIDNVEQSILRAFRGETAEVINDGSNGEPAVVRVIGVDDYYWLVEYTLITEAVDKGTKALTQPLGIELVADYILKPGSNVLEIEFSVRATEAGRKALLSAGLITFGDSMHVQRFADNQVRVGGFSFDQGIPWLAGSDGDGAYAFSIQQGEMGHANIGGIDIFVDTAQAVTNPLLVEQVGDVASMRWFVAAGETDSNSAVRHLADVNPEPLDERPYVNAEITGQVVDASGVAVANARVDVETEGDGTEYQVLDAFMTDADGRFSGTLPDFAIGVNRGWQFRLRPVAEGRDVADPVEVTVPVTDAIVLTVPALGTLEHELTDADGGPTAARFEMVRQDGLRRTLFVYGTGKSQIPPGTYDFTATRGFEHKPVTGTVEIPADGSAKITATMRRVVNTEGFMSADTHVHSAPSPDSRVDQALRIRNAAAHGLEVIVATEHEIVASLAPWVESTGLGHLVNTVTGEEVTAVIPEHMTMFPVVPDGTPRGGPVVWYQKDMDQLFAAMRERAVKPGINILNHPGYMNLIDWDRIAGAPRMTDPTKIGLLPNAKLWSWNFDGIEVMNGFSNPLIDGNRRFDNWLSFLNHGHAIHAVGCSDAHGTNDLGLPRTYFMSSTDDPSKLSEAEMVMAFEEGRTFVGAGAFARVHANGTGNTLGDTITDTDGQVALSIEVQALEEIDVTHIQVLANCDSVVTSTQTAPHDIVKFNEVVDVPVTEDAHLVVIAFGRERLPDGLPQFNPRRRPRFITNPIYVDADGDGQYTPPGGKDCTY